MLYTVAAIVIVIALLFAWLLKPQPPCHSHVPSSKTDWTKRRTLAEAVAGLRQRLAAVHAEVDGVDAQGEVDRARLKEIDGRRQAAHALLKQVKDAESEEEQQARRDHKTAKMEAREARSVVAIDGGGTTADDGFVLQKRQRTDEVKSER